MRFKSVRNLFYNCRPIWKKERKKNSGGEMFHNGKGGETRERNREEKWERVRGEEEEGEADHGERSCFYSLSFLAEAEDILSTDGVYLVGQAAFLLYSLVLYSVTRGCLCIITTLLLQLQSNKQHTNITRNRRVCAHMHARAHLTAHNRQPQQHQSRTRRTNSLPWRCRDNNTSHGRV